VRKGEVPVQGTMRRDRVALRLGFVGEDFGYTIDLGLPEPSGSAFVHDPQIKRECIYGAPVLRPGSLLVDRRGPLVRVRSDSGEWSQVTHGLATFDSMLTHLADPQRTPEVFALRDRIRSWRFYDHFRTDADAPARQAQIGTYTPVLDDEGRDLAAALQTIREIGHTEALDAAIDDAFPGAELEIRFERARFELAMRQQGLLRPLSGAELSDGTLRYLLLVAIMLTPRPPELLIFNEPETSLHPDLLPALSRLIAKAADTSQVWVVSHSPGLIAALQEQPGCNSLVLHKELGETRLENESDLEKPHWSWPAR
jgi:predicted ATPase